MRLLMCSVVDTKVGAYTGMYLFRTRGEAVRSFSEAVKDQNSPFYKHPGDYVMYIVGTFDDNTGEVVSDLDRLMGADELGVV